MWIIPVVFIVSVVLLVFLVKFILDSIAKNTQVSDQEKQNPLIKKYAHVNLQRYARVFGNVGLIVTLLFIIWAFEKKQYDDSGLLDLGSVEDEQL